MQSAKELYKYIISKIESIYDEQESSSIAFMLMEHFGVSKQDYVLNNDVKVSQGKLDICIEKLQENIPIQYVLGYEWFYGRKFLVNENVLIPRPETEELCSEILNVLNDNKPYKILDVGSGSGCIPITLKLEKPNWAVESIDISEKALHLANENSKLLKGDVNFTKVDILNDFFDFRGYDVVVSNPPYVLNSEKGIMKSNVLYNEPHLALFVDDNNPFIFYKKIIEKCVEGNVRFLFFEINEQYGRESKELMSDFGFKEVKVKKDFRGKDRIVYGTHG